MTDKTLDELKAGVDAAFDAVYYVSTYDHDPAYAAAYDAAYDAALAEYRAARNAYLAALEKTDA